MKNFLLCLTFCTLMFSNDQNLSFVAISVKDINKSIEWYQKNFNFKTFAEKNDTKYGVKFRLIQNSNLVMEVLEFKNSYLLQDVIPDNIKNPVSIRSIFKFGFYVNNLDDEFKRLKTNGVKIIIEPMKDEFSNTSFFIISDPDGNRIQLFQKHK